MAPFSHVPLNENVDGWYVPEKPGFESGMNGKKALALVKRTQVLDEQDRILDEMSHSIQLITESDLATEAKEARVAEILSNAYLDVNHHDVAKGIVACNIQPFTNYLAQRDTNWMIRAFEKVRELHIATLREEVNAFIQDLNVKTQLGTYFYFIPEDQLKLDLQIDDNGYNQLMLSVNVTYQLKAQMRTDHNDFYGVDHDAVGLKQLLPEIDTIIRNFIASRISDKIGIEHYRAVLDFSEQEHGPAQSHLRNMALHNKTSKLGQGHLKQQLPITPTELDTPDA